MDGVPDHTAGALTLPMRVPSKYQIKLVCSSDTADDTSILKLFEDRYGNCERCALCVQVLSVTCGLVLSP